jgi:hypothetical protein
MAAMGLRWWQAWTGLPAAVDSPASPQMAPLYYRPVWHVGHLVYQGGVPKLKRSSLTGGGFIYGRDLAGKEAPGWQPYATPVADFVGGGLIPSRPAFLTGLGGPETSTTVL